MLLLKIILLAESMVKEELFIHMELFIFMILYLKTIMQVVLEELFTPRLQIVLFIIRNLSIILQCGMAVQFIQMAYWK